MTKASEETARNLLASFYARQKGQIAFLDESYRVKAETAMSSFYIFSAALIDVTDLQWARDRLIAEARANYWHTTQVAKDNQFERIRGMLSITNEVSQLFVIAVNTDFGDVGLELARKEALIQLASQLLSLGINLAVYETRDTRRRKNADSAILAKASEAGFLAGMRFVQVSPAAEPLLWIPDLVSWSLRQELIGTRKGWFESLRSRAMLVAWSAIPTRNEKRLEIASAISSPELSGAPEGEKTKRSSPTSISKEPAKLQELPGNVRTHVSPIVDPEKLRDWIKKAFPD